jgi:23S rRNA (uridine2552-2'-O)-methyltransferase
MARSKSSKRWLSEHFDDHYVKLAQQQGLRSRSAFKLQEIQEKYHLIQPGMSVVDLGAAPGGWSQVAIGQISSGGESADARNGNQGRVIALDILSLAPVDGVEIIQGDFRDEEPLKKLEDVLDDVTIDLVMSDMAPNMSGIAAADQAGSMHLAELALEFALAHLKPGGHFLVKLVQGEGFDSYVG